MHKRFFFRIKNINEVVTCEVRRDEVDKKGLNHYRLHQDMWTREFTRHLRLLDTFDSEDNFSYHKCHFFCIN